jgi:hypothetical protein
VHSGRDCLVHHISKQHPLMHKESQILVLAVCLPFSKTMTQDMPHFLTTYTISKGQPLPLHTNLHADIMLLYQVLCSYFPGITKWESHGEEWHLTGGIQQENRNPPGSGQYPNTLHRWNSNHYTTEHPPLCKVAFSNHEYNNHYTTWYSTVGCCNSTLCTLEHTQYSTCDNY